MGNGDLVEGKPSNWTAEVSGLGQGQGGAVARQGEQEDKSRGAWPARGAGGQVQGSMGPEKGAADWKKRDWVRGAIFTAFCDEHGTAEQSGPVCTLPCRQTYASVAKQVC
jgi:hypothetical protein